MSKLPLILLSLCLLAFPCTGRSLSSRVVRIGTEAGSMRMRVLQPKDSAGPVPGILWIHGGGYMIGGGLTAAICLYARDKGDIPIALQLPLYPMLDCEDTQSSSDNHGHVWNTKRNHWGWKHYLGNLYGSKDISKYASPARETDYSGLPPCYTFVADGEPFYSETLAFVKRTNGT